MSIILDQGVLRSELQRALRAGADAKPTPRDFATSLAAGIAAGLAAASVDGGVDGTIVRTSGSYADPAWVASLAASKITGALPAVSGAALTALTSSALSGALPAVSGAAVTSLDAANVASGALADARLSANIPLKNAANTFTGLPQTVQHDGLAGGSLIPTGDLVLVNATLAGRDLAAYGDQGNSPGLFFLAQQWNGGASVQGGAAMHFKTLPGTGQTGILQVSCKYYPTGAWERVFDFPSLGPFGIQEGVSHYQHRYKGAYHAFETGVWVTKLDGFTVSAALSRETGTEALQIRSCAAGAAVKIQDSAGAVTQVDGANLMSWATVTGTSQAIASRTGYIANNAGLVTLSLPAAAAVGERIAVTGLGAGGWKISQAAGQTIHDGAGGTTTGVGGHVDSASRWDAITLQCVIANLDWVVIARGGAPTFT